MRDLLERLVHDKAFVTDEVVDERYHASVDPETIRGELEGPLGTAEPRGRAVEGARPHPAGLGPRRPRHPFDHALLLLKEAARRPAARLRPVQVLGQRRAGRRVQRRRVDFWAALTPYPNRKDPTWRSPSASCVRHAGLIATRRDQGCRSSPAATSPPPAQPGDQICEIDPDAIVVLGTDHMKAWPSLAGGIPPARHRGRLGRPRPSATPASRPATSRCTPTSRPGCSRVYIGGRRRADLRRGHPHRPLVAGARSNLFDPEVPYRSWRSPRTATSRRGRPCRPATTSVSGCGRPWTPCPDGLVFIATGGLSSPLGRRRAPARVHAAPARLAARGPGPAPVELEETGPVNEQFDKELLDATCRPASWVGLWTAGPTESCSSAKPATGRTSCALGDRHAGVLGEAPGEVLAYEPIAEWLTGVGIVRFATSGELRGTR